MYTLIAGGGGLLPSSRVSGGMVLDKIDTCISRFWKNHPIPSVPTTANTTLQLQIIPRKDKFSFRCQCMQMYKILSARVESL